MTTGYLTPDSLPEAVVCREFFIPKSTEFLGIFMGALQPLANPDSWTPYGSLTPQECADVFAGILNQIAETYGLCGEENIPAPFWDDEENVDDEATPETQVWYESLPDTIVSGALSILLTPAAGVVYNATIPKIRLALKKGASGGIVNIIFGTVDILYDTYSPTDEIVYLDLEA